MAKLRLPLSDGSVESYTTGPASPFPLTSSATLPRTVYAAAHVVADPLRMTGPMLAPVVDWEATLKFRHHLWGLGMKIAEAMDTSQRGMGLDWAGAKELIRRSLAEAKTVPGADLACGAGTDQFDPAKTRSLDDVIAAYDEQFAHIEKHGGRAIMMASRALRAAAKSRDDYLKVYDRIIGQAQDKVILHWLGDMFDSQLSGYWASRNVDTAMATVLDLIRAHAGKVDGIKISLLEQRHEEKLRAALPAGVKMYTGDDFNYADLIEGDGKHVSHALLGIFDPIAPAAAAALQRLAAGDGEGYHAILDPTVALSRKIFEAPTQFYKAGVVFLAWLNGFQDHFRMIGGMDAARGILHYAEVFRLADKARLLVDPELAAARMRQLAAVNGVD
jgi:hypothetical protein